MESEDRKELETLLDIVINQIPSYTNMIHSANWDVNFDDCIFGMVYHSFVAKSTEYLKNKLTDTEHATNAESTFEMMNSVSEVFNNRLADIKQAIVSAANT
ncbi:hypothetical protein AAA799E16_01567 [Marine Group I thaumarchaeote SCGC AAA799-E16]|uniref:Uncharacterized protein n=2 Tax=Marine Group I TaxID=905826 RepID=A0A087S8D2_9ARCH|nr:hypothetical protein AAA799E16_01567 [Marine Group I thaumarchaeote SCGC AAA799-E16]KFM21986.1 hypothetical protein AAA799B03_00433 [Marine Group I thaumarchaeote SCGC AAA799-B03]